MLRSSNSAYPSESNSKLRLFNLANQRNNTAEFLTLFYFALRKPLQIWERQVKLGTITRIIDMTDGIPALQILGTKVLSSYITTPPPSFTSLGITLPHLGVIAKYFGRTFAFEVQVLDSLNAKRRIRFSNVQIMSRRNSHMLYVPLQMDIGWNELKIDLSYLIRVGYGTKYKETIRVQIFPNCYLRAVYFSAISVPNNHAVDIIRKSLYPNKPLPNEENQNPENLKLVAYKASNFSLLVPTNLEEFLNMKSVQNIMLATEKSKQNISATKLPSKSKSTHSNVSNSSKSKQDIIFSITPIIPRTTSTVLVLKEADKNFISQIKKDNERVKRSKKPAVAKKSKASTSTDVSAMRDRTNKIILGAEARKLDIDLQGAQIPKSMRQNMIGANNNNKGFTGTAIRSKSVEQANSSGGRRPSTRSERSKVSFSDSKPRPATAFVSTTTVEPKFSKSEAETSTDDLHEMVEPVPEEIPIVHMDFGNSVQVEHISPQAEEPQAQIVELEKVTPHEELKERISVQIENTSPEENCVQVEAISLEENCAQVEDISPEENYAQVEDISLQELKASNSVQVEDICPQESEQNNFVQAENNIYAEGEAPEEAEVSHAYGPTMTECSANVCVQPNSNASIGHEVCSLTSEMLENLPDNISESDHIPEEFVLNYIYNAPVPTKNQTEADDDDESIFDDSPVEMLIQMHKDPKYYASEDSDYEDESISNTVKVADTGMKGNQYFQRKVFKAEEKTKILKQNSKDQIPVGSDGDDEDTDLDAEFEYN